MKKNLKSILLIFLLFLSLNVKADKVEDIFVDINSNYTYLKELQSLYDNKVIYPDSNSRFNPNALLQRDEFVGMVMEVGCDRCIQPNTFFEYIQKYSSEKIFYDINNTNKYFYCIALAKDKQTVRGYDIGHTCEDSTNDPLDVPFCPNNNITLEEALAVLLRNSLVFTTDDNNQILSQINSGIITESLSNDIHPKLQDNTAYTFYGYFKKALDISYTEYDIYGNEKKYDLVKIDSNGNLNPKKNITKEEFLKMAYIISNINACNFDNYTLEVDKYDFGLKIEVLDKECNIGDIDCNKSDLNDENGIYDFNPVVGTNCSLGIKNYTWYFYNKTNLDSDIMVGEYLDNYQFKSEGIWDIKLVVEDNCSGISEAKIEISYFKDNQIEDIDNNLSVGIEANPIIGKGPLEVDFESIVQNCEGCKYYWDFGDGNISNLKDPTNTFIDSGVYEVILIIEDKYGNKAEASVIIYVYGDDESQDNDDEKIIDYTKDADGDGIPDYLDKCPTISGPIENSGCPILEESCNEIKKCSSGYICSSKGYCEPQKPLDLAGTCVLENGEYNIFGNIVCNSCPCNYKFDFISQIRGCDIVFPTILSPDGTQIYSRGEAVLVPKD